MYERIGLQIKRRLKCYHGPLPEKMPSDIVLEERPVTWAIDSSCSVGPYAWDMSDRLPSGGPWIGTMAMPCTGMGQPPQSGTL